MAKTIKLEPLGKRVLIQPDKIEETTKGGLVLPPSASEDQKPETGTVAVSYTHLIGTFVTKLSFIISSN